MRTALDRRAPEIAGLGLLLVIATLVWLARDFVEQNGWITHSLEIEKSLGKLLYTVQDAETGQRGYLLTGNKEFLAPYTSARRDIASQLERLRSLVADNPEQVANFAEARAAIGERLDSLEERIEEYQRGRFVSSNLQEGRARMLAVRSKISQMQAIEAGLLSTRTRTAEAIRRAVLAAAIIGTMFCLGMIFFWIRWSRRQAAELDANNRSLRLAMAERDVSEDKLRQMHKMEAIGQLTGGIAHDFNNMLAVVIGAVGLAQRRLSKGDTDVAPLLAGAMDGANRAATLTKRLLAFSRQQALSPQSISANKIVAGLSELISRTIGQQVHAETVLSAGLWSIHADPVMLENAIINLCVNARDAMPDGGRLTIETSNAYLDEAYLADQQDLKAGQYVMIAVTDTGCGMRPDVLKKAFDPFFTTKAQGKGTGLGLSQVHGFVKQSGGHIKAYSEPGAGTSVKMYFPRFMDANAETRIITEGGSVVTVGRSAAPHSLVLVVEDDPSVRETSVAMLRDLGYATLEADAAASALRVLDANKDVALLFTDIVMPEINGRKLADEALKRSPGLKVLFTTGFTRNAVVHNGVLDSGVHLLQKPFTIDELAAKVHQLLAEEAVP